MSKKDDDDSLWDYIKRTVTPLRDGSVDEPPVGDDDFAALLDGENKTSNRRNKKTRATGADQTSTPSENADQQTTDQKTAGQKTADEIKADTPAPSQSVPQHSGAQGRMSAGVSGEMPDGTSGGGICNRRAGPPHGAKTDARAVADRSQT